MRFLRRALAAVVAVALGAGLAFGVYHLSVEPGAALVKTVFEHTAGVTPPSGFAAIKAAVSVKKNVTVTTVDAPDASIDIYEPSSSNDVARPMILWIHGGGFISSSAQTVADYAILLASEGYVVASLDYTLAPTATHPVPVRQANAALLYLAAHAKKLGGDASRIVIGGDSAGAQIASEVAAAETSPSLASDLGLPSVLAAGTLRGSILYCGLYNMATLASTSFSALRTYLWAYTGDRDWTNYSHLDELSTTKQVTAEYPATFLSVGDSDPLASQSAELAAALRAKGVTVDSLFWTGSGDDLGHEYQFNFSLSQATTAFDRTVAFLASVTAEQ
jgi:acetyl esterase/lipase